MNPESPLVSIGVPVYNAEKYVGAALDSLLAQDYQNLEIIISDNGSYDATRAICERYAAADSRVRYLRRAENIGALGNFEDLRNLATGKYFLWHAHDDLREPTYVSETVAQLEAHPEAVCCFTETVFIDEAGVPLKQSYEPGHPDFGSLEHDRRKRVRLLVARPGWWGIYGLMRVESLKQTRPLLNVIGNDLILLLELCLQGPVLKIRKPLFVYRTFQAKSLESVMKSLDPANQQDREHHYLDIYQALLETIEQANLPAPEKLILKYEIVLNACFRNRMLRKEMGAEALKEAGWLYRQGHYGKLVRTLPYCLLAVPDKIRTARESNEARLVDSYRRSKYGQFLRSLPLYLVLSPGKLFHAEAWSAAFSFFRRSKPTMSRN